MVIEYNQSLFDILILKTSYVVLTATIFIPFFDVMVTVKSKTFAQPDTIHVSFYTELSSYPRGGKIYTKIFV